MKGQGKISAVADGVGIPQPNQIKGFGCLTIPTPSTEFHKLSGRLSNRPNNLPQQGSPATPGPARGAHAGQLGGCDAVSRYRRSSPDAIAPD